MLKVKLISRLMGMAAAVSVIGFAAKAMAAGLYLAPGEVGTMTAWYEASGGGEYSSHIEWRISLWMLGKLEFAEGSLFEIAWDGTRYGITDNAISDRSAGRNYRQNSQVQYRPKSARDVPGGETTAGLVTYGHDRSFEMEVGIRLVDDMDFIFDRIRSPSFGGEAWREDGSSFTLDSISSIYDLHGMVLGEVSTSFTLNGVTSMGYKEIILDLSKYKPPVADLPPIADDFPVADNLQDVPEPASGLAFLALGLAGMTSARKRARRSNLQS
ncbi:MAG: hypothetical protein Fur0042_20670 [Cyanophyceae cyanobacterium]